MNWILFLQIEIIALTLGFVGSFLIDYKQTVADKAASKRWSAIAKAFEDLSNNLIKKANEKKPYDRGFDNTIKTGEVLEELRAYFEEEKKKNESESEE